MSGDWYHKRWGFGSKHKDYKKYDWKQNIFEAKRKLKESCTKCEQPILKGQKYVRNHWMVNFGSYGYDNYHLDCFLEERGEEAA